MLGQLASIGIEKGKPFAPDARMKKILTEAAAVGNATARAIVFQARASRKPTTIRTAPGSRCFIGGSYEFLSQPGVRDLDARMLTSLLRDRHHARDGYEDGRRRLAIRRRCDGFRGQAARWQQDL